MIDSKQERLANPYLKKILQVS